jgi:DUF4097 and DUF4098 domain-containing protein YvlB
LIAMKFFVLSTMVAAAGLAGSSVAQTSGSLTRDGQNWLQTANGTFSVAPASKLRITASGNVVLRGDSSDRVVYTLQRRMKARTEVEARALLRGFEVKTTTRGDWLILTVTSPSLKTVSAEVSVSVPRTLRQAWIETNGGNVEAYDFDGHVEARTGGGTVQIDRIKQGTTVRAGGGNITIGRVSGPVKCYSGGGNMKVESAGGDSWFQTAGGEIFVKEVLGPVHVWTGAGNIKIVRSTATVFARTAGGVIEIDQALGLVSAQNSGGAIQVNAANGVHCESNSGAIRLRNVDGPLRAATAAGNIIAELLAGHPIEDSMLSTNTGDITVFIPSNLAMTVVARNESAGAGRIVSDFPEIRSRQNAVIAPLVAQGTLNGGGPVLRLIVRDGTIYLRREK